MTHADTIMIPCVCGLLSVFVQVVVLSYFDRTPVVMDNQSTPTGFFGSLSALFGAAWGVALVSNGGHWGWTSGLVWTTVAWLVWLVVGALACQSASREFAGRTR